MGVALVFAVSCSSSDVVAPQNDASSTAGSPSGGASAGGSSQGGASAGGSQSGGSANGGTSAGGTSGSGGSGSGAAGSAGGGGAAKDASSDAPASDPCATARFCETFESYAVGKAPAGGWKTQTNMGAVSVVDTEHFGGGKSAKFTTEAASGGKTAYIRLDQASVFPVPGNNYFGRMMARLEAAPDQSVHWTFIQSGGVVTGDTYHALYRYGGQQPVKNGSTFVGTQLMANYDTPDSYSGKGPSSDCWNHSNGKVMPVAKWTCVEWQFDGAHDTLRFWLDGAAIDALTVQGTGQGCVHQDKTFEWKAPTFADVELGWESYQMDTERTLYIDDVVISTTRVGCPAGP